MFGRILNGTTTYKDARSAKIWGLTILIIGVIIGKII